MNVPKYSVLEGSIFYEQTLKTRNTNFSFRKFETIFQVKNGDMRCRYSIQNTVIG
jgi:hypothetical protein